jgi:hypothetical protein
MDTEAASLVSVGFPVTAMVMEAPPAEAVAW